MPSNELKVRLKTKKQKKKQESFGERTNLISASWLITLDHEIK